MAFLELNTMHLEGNVDAIAIESCALREREEFVSIESIRGSSSRVPTF